MSRLNAPDEEQFILRLPADVADRMRATLRGHPSARHEDQHMELNFLGEGCTERAGVFAIGEDVLQVAVRELPCVVEAFKTYDGQNLVKSNDIGQILVARRPTETPPEAVKVKGFEDREEVCDGLSAPLTNVRATRFHKPVAEPDNLQAVEKALAVTISGGQPRQTDLHVEVVEEWVSEDEFEAGGTPGGATTPGDSMSLGLTPTDTPQPTPPPKPKPPKKLAEGIEGPNQFDVDDPVAALEAALG